MGIYKPPPELLDLLAERLSQEDARIERIPAIPHRYWRVSFSSGSEHFLSWRANNPEDWQIGSNTYNGSPDSMLNHWRFQCCLSECIESYAKKNSK